MPGLAETSYRIVLFGIVVQPTTGFTLVGGSHARSCFAMLELYMQHYHQRAWKITLEDCDDSQQNCPN